MYTKPGLVVRHPVFTLLFAATCFFLWHGSADAGDYYVATNGNDTTGNGTLANPYRTIQKGANMAGHGETVYIRGGTYRETVTMQRSGEDGSPITFRPYGSEGVTVSGLNEVAASGWSQYPSNPLIYQKTVSIADPTWTQVFANGKAMQEARWPNPTYANPLVKQRATADTATNTGGNAWTVGNSSLNFANGALNGARIVLQSTQGGLSGWTYSSTITGNTGNNVSFNWAATGYLDPGVNDPYHIYNSLAVLDAQKEWYYDGSKLYLYAPGGVNPGALQSVEVRQRANSFDTNHQSFINISGIRMLAASPSISQSSNITINNCQILYPDPVYYNNDSPNKGSSLGVRIIGSNNTISHCEIGNAWGSAVTISAGSNNLITNNVIHDVSLTGTNSTFVSLVPGTGNVVSNNTMYNAGAMGIVQSSGTGFNNQQVLNNDISRFGYLACDLGGFYTAMSSGTGNVVAYNRIHDSRSVSPWGGGIFLDYGVNDLSIHNNVVSNISNGASYHCPNDLDPISNIQFYNNTLWSVNKAMDTRSNKTNTTTYNNLSNSGTWGGNTVTNNYTTTSGSFVNSANGDFRLVAGSYPIDKGTRIGGVPVEPVGGTPDAGAFEYGTSAADTAAGANWRTWTAGNQVALSPDQALVARSDNQNSAVGMLGAGTKGAYNFRSFLSFNLSGVNRPIAVAKLMLYEPDQDSGNSNHTGYIARPYQNGGVTLHKVLDAWDGNMYGKSVDAGTAFFDPENLDMYTEIDVTAIVTAWLANPSSNHGFSLRGAEGAGDTLKFFGGAGMWEDATPPQLLITYVPEPASLVLLLSAGLAGCVMYGCGKWKSSNKTKY
jgi:hypothetical protein